MVRHIVSATLSVLALLGVATPSAGQQKWVEYRSAAGGYRVEFPDTPKIVPLDVQTKDGAKHLELPQVALGDLFFISNYADLSAAPANPQVYLDKSRDGSVANSKGTLRTSQRLTVGGLPARRFVFEKPPTSVVVHLTVLSGKRLYQLESVVPAGQENSAIVQHFIDSFALVAH